MVTWLLFKLKRDKWHYTNELDRKGSQLIFSHSPTSLPCAMSYQAWLLTNELDRKRSQPIFSHSPTCLPCAMGYQAWLLSATERVLKQFSVINWAMLFPDIPFVHVGPMGQPPARLSPRHWVHVPIKCFVYIELLKGWWSVEEESKMLVVPGCNQLMHAPS